MSTHMPPPPTPRAHNSSTTPIARGAAIRHSQEGNPDRFDKYDRAEYEEYIREDLSRRVFVDFGVFLERVLHVPSNWKELWGPAIDAVQPDAIFQAHHKFYCNMCEQSG
jgi:hypothetical protein